VTPGAPVHLRPLDLRDAPAVFALSRAIVADRRGVVLDDDELSLERTEAALQRHLDAGPDALVLGALRASPDGALALLGTVDVHRHPLRRLRHGAVLTIGVHPAAQGQGLGRRLMRAALGWADAAGIARVELFVLADNARAIGLYTSLGFVEEGRRRGFCAADDGGWVDHLVMAVHPGPTAERFAATMRG